MFAHPWFRPWNQNDVFDFEPNVLKKIFFNWKKIQKKKNIFVVGNAFYFVSDVISEVVFL